MTQPATTYLRDVIGRDVYDTNDQRIGTVKDVYADDETDQPKWLAITGAQGARLGFVPLDSTWHRDPTTPAGHLQIPYTVDQVRSAPHVDPDGHLEPDEEDRLYDHYKRGRTGTRTSAGRGTTDSGEIVQEVPVTTEHVDIDKTATQGTARLRKITETETVTVPIHKERVVLETDDDSDLRR